MSVVVSAFINACDLGLLVPLLALSNQPKSLLFKVFSRIRVGADSVLFALEPVALIDTAVCPVVDSPAFFLVVDKLTFVADTIAVSVDSNTVHVVVDPVAVVLATIDPVVRAQAVDSVVFPHAAVLRAISPSVDTESVLLSVFVTSVVLGSFCPRFRALAMLHILLKVTLIGSTLAVTVFSFTLSLVVVPGAFVHVASGVVEGSLALCDSQIPLAFILGAITPSHRTRSVPQISFPPASVDGPGFEHMLMLLDLIFGEAESKTLLSFFLLEVLDRRLIDKELLAVLSLREECTHSCLHSAQLENVDLREVYVHSIHSTGLGLVS